MNTLKCLIYNISHIFINNDQKIKLICFFSLLVSPILFLSTDIVVKETEMSVQQIVVPEPVVPVYDKLKDLYLTTNLISDSKPVITIVSPKVYSEEGLAIQKVIKALTGVSVTIVNDSDPLAAVPLQGNLILLGNRSTNKTINELYDRGYTFLDFKYPGPNGYVVRSLHNPFGDGKNILFAGGSDLKGVKEATEVIIGLLKAAGGKKGSLSVGYLCKIRLGDGYTLPDDIRQAEIWEASKMYGSSGYFGWNMVSKNMALYYMTDDDRYLKEFLRLAFPDKIAIKEIEDYDGERIENKTDPLAGPYHYAAHMMIELWDLIEESPAFTDEQRLKITNAFARQLPHRVVEGIYRRTNPASSLGDRHGDWAAFSLYILGRYFEKDYHNPVWQRCMQAADIYFSALKNTYWIAGNNDHLFWFTSYYDPLLNYLLFTGIRDPEMMANLRRALNTQEILSTGLDDDWGIRASSLSMLNKAAYILHDGRWLYFREKIDLKTDIFRLGQSFWPGTELKSAAPDDLTGKWKIQWMPKGMWQMRATGFPQEQSFRWGSYRSELGPGGDFILLDGYNGAGRNPFHTFDILELRLNGTTLLKGYYNQVLSSADGMVEPKVAMDGALLYNDVIGQVVTAVAEVPDLPFINWKRSICLRNGQYALITDDLGFRTNSDNLSTETTWEMPGAVWIPEQNYIKIQSGNTNDLNIYELHSSDFFEVNSSKVITMKWHGSVKNGEHRTFFHLLARNSGGQNNELASLRLTDNAAALSLPESAIAVVGQYQGIRGDLVVLGKKSLYGHAVRTIGLNRLLMSSNEPVEVDWDFDSGRLTVVNSLPVKFSLALNSQNIEMDNKTITGNKENSLYSFNLMSGRHEIRNAKPDNIVRNSNATRLTELLEQARTSQLQQQANKSSKIQSEFPKLNPIMQANVGVNPIESIIIPSLQGDLIAVASGRTVTFLTIEGKEVRKMNTSGDVRVLRWWAETKLLLVGCADEQVIAFDDQGQKKWEFTSIMDQEVYEAGKQYWFKSAHPGIYGLFSGKFDNGQSRAFVGSACTLEILDETGQLVKRMPVFWGPGRQFLLVDAEDGSKNLLIGRWHNDREDMAIINSNKMGEIGRGYNGVPAGHSYVNGWDCMNRFDNFLVDMDGDGKREVVSAINGTWNRISIYSEKGKPLYNAQIGPGLPAPRANISMMDVGDITNDRKSEIVFGLSSGLINALDGQAEKLWATSLLSPPTVVKIIPGSGIQSWICTGCEDGTILALDSQGKILKQGKVKGKPSDIQVLKTNQGSIAVVITDAGEVIGFKLNNQND